MKRHLFYFIIILYFTQISLGQNTVNSFPIPLKEQASAFILSQEELPSTYLFLNDKHKLIVTQLDNRFQVTDFITAKRPDLRFTKVQGLLDVNANPQLFWTTENSDEVVLQELRFQDKSQHNTTYNLNLKNQKVICSFSDQQSFFTISILRNSNTLHIHKINADNGLSTETIQLDSLSFYDSKYSKTNLYKVLQEPLLPFEDAFTLQHIDSESPLPLAFASKKRKYYLQNGKLIISLDTNTDYTQLLTVDFKDNHAFQTIIYKPFINFKSRNELNSNSIIVGDFLVQYKLSVAKEIIQIVDFQGNILKSYQTQSQDTILYKNTGLLKNGHEPKDNKTLGSTKAFLSKTKRSHPGILAYKYDDQYILKWGSITHQGGVPLKIFTYTSLYFALDLTGAHMAYTFLNPTLDNINAYSDRNSVYASGKFSLGFEHQSGAIPELAFDKIHNYWNNKNHPTSAETIFKRNNKYYIGYFNKDSNKYLFKVFTDQ